MKDRIGVDWTGVFPAVTTKLKSTGDIDVPATQASIERLIAGGVSGIIVLPMLGENASLSMAVREVVIRSAKEVVAGRVPVLSGLAETSSVTAASSAREYERLGADGLMAFPSLIYKTDVRETAEWYQHIAASCGLPIMIYNNPIAYKVDVGPETLRLLEDTPSIVAIKEETGDTRRITDLYNAFDDRFKIFCGIDDLLLESVALGATGWVSGMTNVWPRECVALFDLCAAGQFREALALYRVMTPAFHLDTDVKLVQYIKFADHVVNGAPEWTRPPRLPIVGAERERVLGVIDETVAGLKRIGPTML
jgi:4-hydroxy-tetrahydrodipicolinate synthase